MSAPDRVTWPRENGVHEYIADVRALSGSKPMPLQVERSEPMTSLLDTVSASDFCDVELGPIDYLVKPIIVRGGMTTFYGLPKVGKTTFVMHATSALLGARGDFLNGTTVIDGPALLLDLEQPRRVTIRRISEAGPSTRLHIYRGPPPKLGQLLATIDAYGIKLLVVDSITRWLMLENENDASEFNLKLGPVLEGLQSRDVTTLTIDHANKGDAKDGKNLRGTIDKLAKVDIAVEVRAEGPLAEGRRRLGIISREEIVDDLIVRFQDGRFDVEGSPKAVAYHANRERIEKGIRFGHTRKETLADHLHVSTKTLEGWIAPLIAEGAVEVTKANTRGAPIIYTLGTSQKFLGSSNNGSEP